MSGEGEIDLKMQPICANHTNELFRDGVAVPRSDADGKLPAAD